MQGCQVTAVDPNRSMEPYARENAATHGLQGFEAVEGLAEQLPFSDSTFDRAVCTLVNLPTFATSNCHPYPLHMHLLDGNSLLQGSLPSAVELTVHRWRPACVLQCCRKELL